MMIACISVPYNLDQQYVGMGQAPRVLIDAGVRQCLEHAGCRVAQTGSIEIPDSGAPREERLGALLAQLGAAVARARAGGMLPLVLGGDCLTALGTLAGLGRPAETGVVWFDAHGDFNTPETTPSGYLGGMPLACAVGRGLDDLRMHAGLREPVAEQHVALLAVRDLDPPEEQALAASDVRWLRTNELARDDMALDAALAAVRGLPQVYLHIDIDVLDPAIAPGVDFPAPGGLSLATLQQAVQRVTTASQIAAVALTAVNPERDQDGRTVQAALAVLETIGRAWCRTP